MTLIAPTVQAFFTQRLLQQRHASAETVAAYRDAIRLLLAFSCRQTGKQPSRLDIDDLDAPHIAAFLDDLQHGRENIVSTRNARLAAIRSLFRFAALRHPEHAATIQRVLAIPMKKTDRPVVTHLDQEEIDALLAAPDLSTWAGRRDHALLLTAIQTGLRVSELVGLVREDVHLGHGAHVSCTGKGRKQRCTPLTPATVKVLRAWLGELARNRRPTTRVFPNRTGGRLSRDAVERRLAKHIALAVQKCPSIGAKRVTPHVLRHTAAMQLLQAGVDTSVIALWLGHEKVETTQVYLHADLKLKEQALARTTPPTAAPGRYRPPEPLLAFLTDL
jgi:site-specific recombinase XerD